MSNMVPDNNQIIYENLADVSAKDKSWDKWKGFADQVQAILTTSNSSKLIAQGRNMLECSNFLNMLRGEDKDTGDVKYKLHSTNRFCRVRNCPTCQERRAKMWQAKMIKAMPGIMEGYPNGRWIFLTLTWKNCKIENLKEELSERNNAWHRLVKTKAFDDVIGWVKTNEVTMGDVPGHAHPHFHVLLFVKSTYFKTKGHFITQEQWTDYWQKANKFDYIPRVDVRAVKTKRGEPIRNADDLKGAICEVLKYSVKPDEMIKDPAWFLELCIQLNGTRAIASGGVLKDVFRKERHSRELLCKEGGEELENPDLLRYWWHRGVKKYRRKVGAISSANRQAGHLRAGAGRAGDRGGPALRLADHRAAGGRTGSRGVRLARFHP